MARLDRLGSAKGVARLAAAIGREFSYELLFAVAGLTESELTAALDRLTGAGLLFREGTPPHASYLFKHALVRDAAYGLLLRDAEKGASRPYRHQARRIVSRTCRYGAQPPGFHFTEGSYRKKPSSIGSKLENKR